MQLSWWEKDTLYSQKTVIIIGQGLVGSSTAFFLKQRKPQWKIAVVDALPPGIAGASSRNAGFACFGSPSEILADMESMGSDKTWELVKLRWDGLSTLRALIGDDNMDYIPSGGVEVFNTKSEMEKANHFLPQLNRQIQEITGKKNACSLLEPQQVKAWKMQFSGFIANALEGQLHPGKMMSRLWKMANESGVEFLHGIEVVGYEENSKELVLQTNRGIKLHAAQLVICANGFARKLAAEKDVQPARNQVILTKPISQLPWKGCFHLDRGYVYFRNVGDKVLIGGGRNLAEKEESTPNFGQTEKIMAHLIQALKQKVLPGFPFEVEQVWSGILGVGKEKMPILERHSPRVIHAFRLGGMGVAIGSLLGKKAANLILND